MIDGQVVTLDSLGNLLPGDHRITYDTVLKSGVAANGGDLIKAENKATSGIGLAQATAITERLRLTLVTFGYDMIKKSNGSGTPSGHQVDGHAQPRQAQGRHERIHVHR